MSQQAKGTKWSLYHWPLKPRKGKWLSSRSQYWAIEKKGIPYMIFSSVFNTSKPRTILPTTCIFSSCVKASKLRIILPTSHEHMDSNQSSTILQQKPTSFGWINSTSQVLTIEHPKTIELFGKVMNWSSKPVNLILKTIKVFSKVTNWSSKPVHLILKTTWTDWQIVTKHGITNPPNP